MLVHLNKDSFIPLSAKNTLDARHHLIADKLESGEERAKYETIVL